MLRTHQHMAFVFQHLKENGYGDRTLYETLLALLVYDWSISILLLKYCPQKFLSEISLEVTRKSNQTEKFSHEVYDIMM